MALLRSTTRLDRTKSDSIPFKDSNGLIADGVVVLDEDGGQAISLSGYKISDIDADASPNYYGFERADTAWYILEETLSAGADTYRYIKGSSAFATSWGNRLVLSYDTFANTF